jgi:hypothetical protein
MNNFENSIEYEEIKNQLQLSEIINHIAKFVCYSDNMLIYEFNDKQGWLHEFVIICDSDMLAIMPIIKLIQTKRVKYFKYSIYESINKNNNTDNYGFIASKQWTNKNPTWEQIS